MDQRPPDQDDRSYIEFEITDIDAEEHGARGRRVARSSLLRPAFEHMARHNRLWFTGAISLGCVIICLLIFPDIASLIRPTFVPVVIIGTPTFEPDRVDVYPGSDHVTLLMGVQTDAQFVHMTDVSVTAYDTQSGKLLWHTPPLPSSTTTYGQIINQQNQDYDVYAHQSDGLISLLAPRTGKVLWHYAMPTIVSAILESDHIFFFQGTDNTIYAIEDGRLLWHDARPENIVHIENGIVYTYNPMQQRYSAISERSGQRFWTYAAPVIVQPSVSAVSMVIENNVLYFQTVDNTLRALQLNGHVLWTHQLADPINFIADAHDLYAIDPLAGELDIFNLQKGTIENHYKNEIGAISLMDIQHGLLYIRAPEGVRVVDVHTGNVVWQHKTPAINQPMDVANGTIYLLPGDGTSPIQALDERNGTLRWSSITQEQVSSGDSVALNLQSLDFSTLSVLRLSDGKILWSKHVF